MNLHGVFAPIPTPFHDGQLDLQALRKNVERWMSTELTGIVLLGTNGEAALIDDDEADRLIAAARERVPGDRPLVAGTARESTRATIAATRRAADAGADAVLVRTPSFFKSAMTSDALVRHFSAVADASLIPVLLYNFTAATGVNLAPAAVATLSEHSNIIGIKESGGSVEQVAELAKHAGTDFGVVVGAAPTFYASLCVGAVGGVLALACVLPMWCVRLLTLVEQRRFDEALELQRQLTPLARLVTTVHGVPGLKAALDVIGYVGGDARAPLLPLRPDAVEEIRQALKDVEDWASARPSAGG